MSLKASSLKKNNAQIKAIGSELVHILNKIDDDLKIAHDDGRKSAVVSVPINFSIPYMKNSDAQRIIYYKILRSLLDRGFHPRIELKKTATVFNVSWLSDEEKDEIKVQNTLLAKYTTTRSIK